MDIRSWSDSSISHLCLPVSKAFVRSIKATKSGCRCSLHFSYSCRRENTISMVDLLARKTHCNSEYSLCQNLEPLQCYSSFLLTVRRVMPQYLLQSLLSPLVLFSVKMFASLMSYGPSPSLQLRWNYFIQLTR